MKNGYIKLWRKIEESPIFTNSEAVHLFIYLLIKASRVERKTAHKETVIELKPGQLVTGRKKLSEATGINESKVYRILELLKSEQQIEQQTNSKYSIITICNWDLYQDNEQQLNNKRTTTEQQLNTIQECKEVKKEAGSVHTKNSRQQQTDEEWLLSLTEDLAYKHINIKIEFSKMTRWCDINNKKPSRKRFINWLNRIEAPISHGTASEETPNMQRMPDGTFRKLVM